MTNSNTQPNTYPDIYRKEVYQQWSSHSSRPPASAPNPLDSDSLKTLVHATASLPAPAGPLRRPRCDRRTSFGERGAPFGHRDLRTPQADALPEGFERAVGLRAPSASRSPPEPPGLDRAAGPRADRASSRRAGRGERYPSVAVLRNATSALPPGPRTRPRPPGRSRQYGPGPPQASRASPAPGPTDASSRLGQTGVRSPRARRHHNSNAAREHPARSSLGRIGRRNGRDACLRAA